MLFKLIVKYGINMYESMGVAYRSKLLQRQILFRLQNNINHVTHLFICDGTICTNTQVLGWEMIAVKCAPLKKSVD